MFCVHFLNGFGGLADRSDDVHTGTQTYIFYKSLFRFRAPKMDISYEKPKIEFS